MIRTGNLFNGYELQEKCVFSLGTPTAVKKYMDATYAFLFDLDGTLVITDDIYYNVWSEILIKYNIVLTPEIFKKFIQGNNDKYVLNTLLKNIDISLTDLSVIKDNLFIANMNKIKVIEGVYEFLKNVKSSGHKACIVTNCNKTVANAILKHVHIEEYIDFVISSNDCVYGKPNPEPYLRAIERYQINNNHCFIFDYHSRVE
jgi:HAD superfamily hydrolase (TIGR01549 family)